MVIRIRDVDGGLGHTVGRQERELGGGCLKIYQVGNGSWGQSFILNNKQDKDKLLRSFKNWDKGAYFFKW